MLHFISTGLTVAGFIAVMITIYLSGRGQSPADLVKVCTSAAVGLAALAMASTIAAFDGDGLSSAALAVLSGLAFLLTLRKRRTARNKLAAAKPVEGVSR